ncbi:MAG: acyl transferase [Bacteroidota bacterium]|nr:acyl transferase [Bacteroidota bacterium]MDP3144986.1 acyl transferase [Bacteroidota bacterium]
MQNYKDDIFNIASEKDFLELSLSIFNFQYRENAIYNKWVKLLNVDAEKVNSIEQIPFLPIEVFKTHQVVSTAINSNTIKFTSSSTTSQIPATHFVNDVSTYEKSFLKAFNLFYGEPSAYCFLALLPNYLQRKGSSLVYMCDKLIKESDHPFSGFFLDDIDNLISKINHLKQSNQKVILIGVSYALMDLCDKEIELNENFIVIETGGMKGTRKELLKSELHAYLKRGFKIDTIHSEYGMTELLSQAYSLGNSEFVSPPWMKFLIREVSDPLKIRTDNKTGGINVIDLANFNSCSFIATKDLGKLNENNKLELMGRYDNSDVRGCNLMLGNF